MWQVEGDVAGQEAGGDSFLGSRFPQDFLIVEPQSNFNFITASVSAPFLLHTSHLMNYPVLLAGFTINLFSHHPLLSFPHSLPYPWSSFSYCGKGEPHPSLLPTFALPIHFLCCNHSDVKHQAEFNTSNHCTSHSVKLSCLAIVHPSPHLSNLLPVRTHLPTLARLLQSCRPLVLSSTSPSTPCLRAFAFALLFWKAYSLNTPRFLSLLLQPLLKCHFMRDHL